MTNAEIELGCLFIHHGTENVIAFKRNVITFKRNVIATPRISTSRSVEIAAVVWSNAIKRRTLRFQNGNKLIYLQMLIFYSRKPHKIANQSAKMANQLV